VPIPRGKSTPTLYAAYCVLATVVFVACFRPAPPLEEGDDRDSGLTEAPSPDGDTTAQGHPLLKKRQSARALSLPTPSASSTPATGKTQTTAQTATTGSGVPNDTSTTTTPGLSLTTTTVSGLKPTIDGTCDVTASAYAASSSAGKVQSVTCNGNGELSILIHLPAGDSAFNISVAASYADGKSAVRTQTIQRSPFLCPAGYVGVPGSGIPGLGNASASKGNSNWWLDVDSDFCVMKYPAKNNNASTYATSTIAGAPWVNIQRGADENTTGSAFKACKDAGTGFRLISNTQWQTVARSAEGIAENWSGRAVGNGVLARGNNDGSAGRLSNSTDDDPYFGTGNSETNGWEQRRTRILTNGEIVWDFGGNLHQFVSDAASALGANPTIQFGNEYSNTTYFPITGINANINRLLYAPAGNFNSSQYVGTINGYGTETLTRGAANWGNTGGLFYAYGFTLFTSASDIGFRCAYIP